ncbi:phage holin family protein [Mycobacterium sp. IDR2000157661]|uniref:phage holin family protein n=1 Tax=Mycobacterium sp. IDR2000157661 TaxID=2867005 RepID=UPI001EEE232A|nr:phage holin family protein [Mycobacterium sp. IDR2000157661]ULE34904.1 phage holin family protein [Mycobacterium sp. IDR2000157661]
MIRQVLVRSATLLGSWAVGLLVAAWAVPDVSVTVPAFIVAVVVFSVGQALTSLVLLRLPRDYASLLLGGTGLVLTALALAVAAALTDGLSIDGFASWLTATLVVWLVTTIGAISLPETFSREHSGAARP